MSHLRTLLFKVHIHQRLHFKTKRPTRPVLFQRVLQMQLIFVQFWRTQHTLQTSQLFNRAFRWSSSTTKVRTHMTMPNLAGVFIQIIISYWYITVSGSVKSAWCRSMEARIKLLDIIYMTNKVDIDE